MQLLDIYKYYRQRYRNDSRIVVVQVNLHHLQPQCSHQFISYHSQSHTYVHLCHVRRGLNNILRHPLRRNWVAGNWLRRIIVTSVWSDRWSGKNGSGSESVLLEATGIVYVATLHRKIEHFRYHNHQNVWLLQLYQNARWSFVKKRIKLILLNPATVLHLLCGSVF